MRQILHVTLASLLLYIGSSMSAAAERLHAIAMHGTPKYDAGFTHFDYVNPDAPLGGLLKLGHIGSFDSLNPFIVTGVRPGGLNAVYQTLMSRSKDEPFTLYGNIAKTIEVAPDRSWIIFHLDPKAQFSNGNHITAEDVLFTFKTMRDKGRPNVRTYYRRVIAAEILDPLSVKFTFEEEGRWEMPLIMGLMIVLSKESFSDRDFSQTTLTPFMGSGPYLIEEVDTGRRITYRRDPDFWGWHLPQYKGRYNFEFVHHDYFRDDGVALEAFKAHSLSARFETDALKWQNAYDPDAKDGFIKSEPVLKIPAPMLAMVFNTRRSQFADRRVREALTYAFDFEWINANILQSAYKRTHSYFENSPLAAKGNITDGEHEILSPFAKDLPKEVFDNTFALPANDGSGRSRENMRKARDLLKKAGWTIQYGLLHNRETGEPFNIEFLINNGDYTRLISPYQRKLEMLGIQTTIRQMDTASYQNRLTNFDFDMIINSWGQSLSPGNEQAFYWSQRAAETPGTRNYPGIRMKSVDEMIARVSTAKTRQELVNAARALDRILLWGHYVIPLYYTDHQWVAHWPEIHLPKTPSYWGTSPDLWWYSKVDEQGPLRP
jgi:ABC-type oligopeptide transport system substrate-binding subunit